MTEDQAREAKRLIEAKDGMERLQKQIINRHRSAVANRDPDDIEWLANTAIALQDEVMAYIKRDIQAL